MPTTATTCPKCNFVRPPDTTAPDWQCPSCGVAYAKARAAITDPQSMEIPRKVAAESTGLPWAKVMLGLMVSLMVLAGFKLLSQDTDAAINVKGARTIAATLAADDGHGGTGAIAQLASTVEVGDVVVYSAKWCGTCTQTKAWMASNGFKFTECDMEKSADCANRFRDLGGNAIPLVVVRGAAMRAGFDSTEFLAAVQRGAG